MKIKVSIKKDTFWDIVLLVGAILYVSLILFVLWLSVKARV